PHNRSTSTDSHRCRCSTRSPIPMIKWSGRIIAFIGAGHLTTGLLLSQAYFGDWLSLRLWGH
ncbi:hypothetical protein, partial [Nocardia seriolae]|uniref:hypothetical protein n=1 Tax=Nocardia seriolae TaxID=37332 RepID=UPI001E49C4AC